MLAGESRNLRWSRILHGVGQPGRLGFFLTPLKEERRMLGNRDVPMRRSDETPYRCLWVERRTARLVSKLSVFRYFLTGGRRHPSDHFQRNCSTRRDGHPERVQSAV